MTLTAEEIDELCESLRSGEPAVFVSPLGGGIELDALAAQAKRVPELEAEVARLKDIYASAVRGRSDFRDATREAREELDRYRKVADAGQDFLRFCDGCSGSGFMYGDVPCDVCGAFRAALAAVGMTVKR